MSTLAQQQQALLQSVRAASFDDAIENIANYVYGTAARGLKAYQANGHAMAERALRAAYPVLTQLLGPESLDALARAFWHSHPPVRGDLAQWGDGLADFVRAAEQLAGEPYLPDVVSVEWALHVCTGAADQAMDAASFALLTQQDPDDLTLRLAPGCAVVPSAWPVASIVSAHLEAQGCVPDLRQVGQRLRAGVAETALVWRADWQPRVREALAGEAEFVRALLVGRSLGAAMDAAPALDFNAWLPLAAQTQLLLGAQLVAPGVFPLTESSP
jgi:hypothetical protein